jgi:hypothetical protein
MIDPVEEPAACLPDELLLKPGQGGVVSPKTRQKIETQLFRRGVPLPVETPLLFHLCFSFWMHSP